jgi:hypothetical protein
MNRFQWKWIFTGSKTCCTIWRPFWFAMVAILNQNWPPKYKNPPIWTKFGFQVDYDIANWYPSFGSHIMILKIILYLVISCYVLTLFFIHTTGTCIVCLGDICNALPIFCIEIVKKYVQGNKTFLLEFLIKRNIFSESQKIYMVLVCLWHHLSVDTMTSMNFYSSWPIPLFIVYCVIFFCLLSDMVNFHFFFL